MSKLIRMAAAVCIAFAVGAERAPAAELRDSAPAVVVVPMHPVKPGIPRLEQPVELREPVKIEDRRLPEDRGEDRNSTGSAQAQPAARVTRLSRAARIC